MRLRQWLALLVSIWALANASAQAAELPDDLAIATIPNLTDSLLSTARLVCAAGEMSRTDANAQRYEAGERDVPLYCAAVLREIIKRQKQMELYAWMQDDQASNELMRIFDASSANEATYENVEGVTKTLHCSLAYDAGAIFESYRPGTLEVPNATSEALDEIRSRCFADGSSEPAINGLIAGVLDQR